MNPRSGRFPIGICDNEVVRSLRCYSDSTITWQNPDVPQCALRHLRVPELNAQAFRVAPTLLDREAPPWTSATAWMPKGSPSG